MHRTDPPDVSDKLRAAHVRHDDIGNDHIKTRTRRLHNHQCLNRMWCGVNFVALF